MKIRRADSGDAEAMAALVADMAGRYILPELSEQGRATFLAGNNAQKIAEVMAQGYVYFLAEAPDGLAGLIGMRDNSHVYHLFVAQTYRGQGLSRQLWSLARRHCLDRGNPGRFTVNSSNYALGVYAAFGFQPTAAMQEHQGVLYTPMVLNAEQ